MRVVCQNTLTTGLNSAKVSVALKHNKMIQADTEWYTRLFSRMLTSQDQVIAQMDRLSHYTLEPKDIDTVMNTAYPQPSRPRRLNLAKDISQDDVGKETWLTIINDTKHLQDEYEKRVEAKNRIRNAALERFHVFNDEYPDNANTPWALWQAVVETEDYRKGWQNTASALFGERANIKARAFKSALSLCK